MIKKYNSIIKYLFIAVDIIAIAIAYYSSVFLKFKSGAVDNLSVYTYSFPWIVLLFIVVYVANDAYSPLRGRLFRTEVLILTKSSFIASVIALSILFINTNIDFDRDIAIEFCLFSLITVLVERYVIRSILREIRSKGFNQKHIIIIGAGPVGIEFAVKLQQHRHLGFNLVGFLDDSEKKRSHDFVGKQILGGCRFLPELLMQNSIDEVFVALPLWAHRKYGYIINECERHGVRLRIIPDYNRLLPGNPTIQNFDGIPILNIREIPLDDPFNKCIKRCIDLAVSSIALLLVAPLMSLIAIGIKLTSPGPVLFCQERIGLNNRSFNMLKFRTMRVADDDSAAVTWTTQNDPRKTSIGTFLRKTSLDELPQFFNVLLGSMSVVGPRPERPFFVDQFRDEIPRYMVKHQVKPGITGWAQINGRDDIPIPVKVDYDEYYLKNKSFFFDLKNEERPGGLMS